MPSKTPSPSKPRRPSHERTVLVLQGGGALGAYQAGVYQVLERRGQTPHWVGGISIGAINAALIAGNAPERRVERLRAFWELVSEPLASATPLSSCIRRNGTSTSRT